MVFWLKFTIFRHTYPAPCPAFPGLLRLGIVSLGPQGFLAPIRADAAATRAALV